MCNVAHFFDQDHGSFLIQHLIDGHHLTQLHQLLDHLGCLDGHFVRQLGNGDGLRDMHFAYDRFGRLLEISFAIVVVTATAAPSARTSTPAITATTTAWAACLETAARIAFLRVVLPSR